jgi:hypothetical protein
MRTKIKYPRRLLVERSSVHNPATPAGHPEGTQPKTEEDTKGPIREIKSKRFGEKLLRSICSPNKKHVANARRIFRPRMGPELGTWLFVIFLSSAESVQDITI